MEVVERKVVFVGDGYVGKTCILAALQQRNFTEQMPNIHDEVKIEQVLNNKRYLMKFIDTAGQEEYDDLRQTSYVEADAFLLCFAVDDKISFDNLITRWIPNLEPYRNQKPIILVGTKLDLKTNGVQNQNIEALRLLKRIRGYQYIECSSKTGTGIDELKKIIFKLYEREKKSCIIQ